MAIQHNKRSPLTIEIDSELAQRLEAAAAVRNLSVPDYVETIVQRAVVSDAGHGEHPIEAKKIEVPALTPEERARGLEAIAELTRIRQELFAKHGKLEPESWELLNESREERTRQLMRAVEE
ncbi:MAG: hypothetical protein ACR2LS_07895 [Thermomicrobiales bacterium]